MGTSVALPDSPDVAGGDDVKGSVADKVEAPSEANALRATVGGSQAIAALQRDYYDGVLPREAAIANATVVFGFDAADAGTLFPEIAPVKLVPEEPPPGLPGMESLTEAASMCPVCGLAECGGKGGKPGPCKKPGSDAPKSSEREPAAASKIQDDALQPKTYGPSKAKTTYGTEFRSSPAQAQAKAKSWGIEGKEASLVGAPDDAKVSVKETLDGALEVRTEHASYKSIRTIGKDSDGNVYIENRFIEVKDQGKGIGTDVFSRQVEQARESGVAYIQAHAASGPGLGKTTYNGYYTWPRLGYDAPVSDLTPKIQSEIGKQFPSAKSVLDIMGSKEGRDWWKANGEDLDNAKFDLRKGSRSIKVLEAYQRERAAR
jgi:hypothetical protein